MTPLYRRDLAYVHHTGFRAVPEAAARWLVAYLATHAVPHGAIVDLGCGSGVFAAGVAQTGRAVIGIDVSRAMLALARRTAPRARFRLGSLHTAALPDAAVVTVIGEGLTYLPATGRVPPFVTTFRRVARCLRPGGLFVFDLLTGPRERIVPSHGFRTGGDWAVLSETRAVRAPQCAERRITVFRAVGARYRRSGEVHRVRLCDREQVLHALRDAGFRATTRRGWDAVSRLPGRTVFIARRRA